MIDQLTAHLDLVPGAHYSVVTTTPVPEEQPITGSLLRVVTGRGAVDSAVGVLALVISDTFLGRPIVVPWHAVVYYHRTGS